MKLHYLPFLLLFLSSMSIAEFSVEKIEIVGLQRVSLGTILNTLGIEKQDRVSDSDLGDSVKRLFRTGYFKDIKVFKDQTSGLVQYEVIEQPAIAELQFDGNKAISTSVLEKVFSEQGLKIGEVFSKGKLEAIIAELDRQYTSMGHYAVNVASEITPIPNNRLNLSIDIAEGQEAKIESIAVTGNHAFSNKELLKVFRLRSKHTATPLQRMGKRTNYSTESVRADQEKLAAWYLDSGYLTYELISTQVALSTTRDAVHLTYNINEGAQYQVSSIELVGDLVDDEEYLNKLVTIKPGTTFARNQLVAVQKAIQTRLSDMGYAFPNIRLLTDVDKEQYTVGLKFLVEPGQRTYVRRINIAGNLSTNEHVIRRELSQLEGALASGSEIGNSRRRLERVGYFSGIRIQTLPVTDQADQVDLNIDFEELKDATLTGSLGYADPGGMFIAGEYRQKNFQGSGKDIAASITSNSYQKELEFSYTNPYMTKDAVSLEYDIFLRETDNSNISENDYATNTWGGGAKIGYPISNNQRISFGLNYTFTDLFANNPAQEISGFIAEHGTSFSNFELSTRWNYSSLNGGFLATEGQSHAITVNATLPFSDLSYYKADYTGRLYMPVITDNYSIRSRLNLGFGDGFGNTSALPFFENFLSGGVYSVRGFEFGSLGPKSTPADGSDALPSAIGGNIKIGYGFDFLFPMPVVKDKTQFRPSLFVDAGSVYSTDCLLGNVNCKDGVDLSTLKYSAGFEVNWMTPIAPLRFIWAWPLNAEGDDQVRNFVFTFGYSL